MAKLMLEFTKRGWRGWQRVARMIGDVQARLLLTVFYFVVLGPFAVVLRWRSDPLAIKRGAPRGWRARVEETPAAHAARQF